LASESWLSTKAFSVYNVLLRTGQAMSADEITSWLQKNFRPDIDDAYVSMGVGYLAAKQMIGATRDGKLGLARPGARVKRVNGDIDLDWA
jgi:hypothetical protein